MKARYVAVISLPRATAGKSERASARGGAPAAPASSGPSWPFGDPNENIRYRWRLRALPEMKLKLEEATSKDGALSAQERVVRRQHRETPAGSRDEYLAIGVYVDDLFVAYSHDDEHSLYHEFTTSMHQRWDVDDEGEVHDLLNIEITREGADVVLRQVSYI